MFYEIGKIYEKDNVHFLLAGRGSCKWMKKTKTGVEMPGCKDCNGSLITVPDRIGNNIIFCGYHYGKPFFKKVEK